VPLPINTMMQEKSVGPPPQLSKVYRKSYSSVGLATTPKLKGFEITSDEVPQAPKITYYYRPDRTHVVRHSRGGRTLRPNLMVNNGTKKGHGVAGKNRIPEG